MSEGTESLHYDSSIGAFHKIPSEVFPTLFPPTSYHLPDMWPKGSADHTTAWISWEGLSGLGPI